MLDELKNYLDITWDDADSDSKLSGILERAETILCSYAGTTIDFTENLSEKQLLFDLCRYIRSNALEDFKNNFSAELIMLRAKYQTEAVEDDEEES